MRPTSVVLAQHIRSQPFKRAQSGLFHGKTRVSGHSISHSEHHEKRVFLPAVHNKFLLSDTLGEIIKVKVTAKALKCIKKAGSLDNYILHTKPELLGDWGMRLRIRLRDAPYPVLPQATEWRKSQLPLTDCTLRYPPGRGRRIRQFKVKHSDRPTDTDGADAGTGPRTAAKSTVDKRTAFVSEYLRIGAPSFRTARASDGRLTRKDAHMQKLTEHLLRGRSTGQARTNVFRDLLRAAVKPKPQKADETADGLELETANAFALRDPFATHERLFIGGMTRAQMRAERVARKEEDERIRAETAAAAEAEARRKGLAAESSTKSSQIDVPSLETLTSRLRLGTPGPQKPSRTLAITAPKKSKQKLLAVSAPDDKASSSSSLEV